MTKEQVRTLQTSEFNISCMQIIRNINWRLCGGIPCKAKIHKYISTWLPKSKVMSNHSLMFAFEEIPKSVDDGSPVDVVYLDFQKAFYKVPHQKLLLKLKAHGNDVISGWKSGLQREY